MTTATVTDRAIAALAVRGAAAIAARGWRVATAESCTGGWIAKALTDVPGSSKWFEGGVVSYSNALKIALLGVPPALLKEHGAVAEPIVRAMADGARTRLGVQLTVAVSGVAGPDGGTADKPVGTVWLAWAAARGTSAELHRFDGDRDAVRRASVARALERLIELATAP